MSVDLRAKFKGELTERRMRRQVARLDGRGRRAMAVPPGRVLARMLERIITEGRAARGAQ